MKYWFPALALVATVSLPALAQEAPPPGSMRPPGDAAMTRPTTQQMAAMQQVGEQMRQIHTAARSQMLAALSAAHRAQLATIVGQLAIAASPDPRTAEAQIDSLLSGGEKAAILTAEAGARTNTRALMESMRTQMEANASADERAQMQQRDAARTAREAQRQTPAAVDAGRTLLRYVSFGNDGRPEANGGMYGHGPGPGGPN